MIITGAEIGVTADGCWPVPHWFAVVAVVIAAAYYVEGVRS